MRYPLLSVVGLGVLAALFFYRPSASQEVQTAPRADVPCLMAGVPLVQHVHTKLVIRVDGAHEPVPPGIGLSSSCERAVHTHEPDSIIHVEAQDTLRYTLGSFFSVWGKGIEREGYDLRVLRENEPYTGAPGDILLKDEETVTLEYTRQ